jgi:hypothetical protein
MLRRELKKRGRKAREPCCCPRQTNRRDDRNMQYLPRCGPSKLLPIRKMYVTTKIVKIADSAIISEIIPTRPRVGSSQRGPFAATGIELISIRVPHARF